MSTMTSANVYISDKVLKNFFHNLVNRFFKILPMRENNEQSVVVYMKSLQIELLGLGSFVPKLKEVKENASFLSLLSILQYLIDYPDCDIKIVKREVFNAISICEKLESYYTTGEEVS